MSEEQRVRFGQTTGGIILIQGVVTAAVSAVVTWAINNAAGLPWLAIAALFLSIGLVVFLVMSLFQGRLRQVMWGWIPRTLAWVFSLRIISHTGRHALEQSGYDRRSAEVAVERATTREPKWHFDARDNLGEEFFYWLENRGAMVTDVSITCDPEMFLLDGDTSWPGVFGDERANAYEGKRFKGVPTERGEAEGVIFHVTWHDNNGDPFERDVVMPPAEFRAGKAEALNEAFARGRAEGRADALAENEAKPPSIPLPRPRWHLDTHGPSKGKFAKLGAIEFHLANGVPTSVAYRVRVDGESGCRVVGNGTWADLSGESKALFEALVDDDAYLFGLAVRVAWLDENGREHSEKLFREVKRR
ncbi:MAG: hypothetical protein KF680_03580 [Cryobacterium sp.]|nr:hypothetical protein [Cryobacterium sp.]